MNRINAIFFDLRNTLLKPRRASGLFCTMARRYGKTVTMQAMSQHLHEVSRQVFLPEDEFLQMLEQKGWRVTPFEADVRWMAYFRLVMERIGLGEKAEEAAKAMDAIYRSSARWEVFPEVPYTLARLKDHHVKLGVVTNWSPRIHEVLDGLGLSPCFDVVVASEIEGYCKPHPHMFQKALAAVGVEPNHAIHVGDSLPYDVQGARNAGMTPVLLDRYNNFEGEHSVIRIRSLKELLERYERHAARFAAQQQLSFPGLEAGGRAA